MMTTQKPPNPQPQADPEVVTGRRLRTGLILLAATFPVAAAVGWALAHLTGHPQDAWQGAFRALAYPAVATLFALILMTAWPGLARWFGVPNTGDSDEREKAITMRAGHTTNIVLQVGLIAYGIIFQEMDVIFLGLVGQFIYYGLIVWDGRRT